MQTRGIRVSYFLALAFAVQATATAAHAQCQYEVTTILAPGVEIVSTRGKGINSDATVAGFYTHELGSSAAFLWTVSGGLQLLGAPDGSQGTAAHAINDLGDIVGGYGINQLSRALLWQDGFLVELGVLPGANFSNARSINDLGQVVGESGNSVTGPIEAFLWQDDSMISINQDLPAESGRARDINNVGQVVGWMGSSPLVNARPFIWDSGVGLELQMLSDGFVAKAVAINDLGEVVGDSRVRAEGYPFGAARAVRWFEGEITNLGLCAGLLQSAAADINDLGQVVGLCWDPEEGPSDFVPFLWQNGVLTNLRSLVEASRVTLACANAINDDGLILVEGLTGAGELATFLLTPIDRPFTDLDGDCRTDVHDLIMLILAWGQVDSVADLNEDGIVDAHDLLMLVMYWDS